jgi:hypothetical protein
MTMTMILTTLLLIPEAAMTPKLYLFYGIAVLGLLATAQFRGWTMSSISEAKVIPSVEDVRDNPGSDRSVYGGYHHYSGGK